MLNLLEDLKNEHVISELNYQFARLIAKKQQKFGYDPLTQQLAILVSAVMSFTVLQGNTCLRLDTDAANNLFYLQDRKLTRDYLAAIQQKIDYLSPLQWHNVLQHHIAFSDDPERVAPMLFQQQRLYFYRYWRSENRIAHYLQQAIQQQHNVDIAFNKQLLAELFPTKHERIDWQKIAVATALEKSFCLISGGPGTGKTYTVALLLAALQLHHLQHHDKPLSISLTAPTGKAAARLKESIQQQITKLTLPTAIELPTTAATLHRLLGIHPLKDLPQYHQKNPLPIDVLVVDEASMINLTLMEKLMNALRPTTRLIMLGDKDQLASVEAGAIMGELGQFITQGYSQSHCQYLAELTGYHIPPHNHGLIIRDSLCHLRHSYRFSDQSGIGLLAMEINAQQAVKSWHIFASEHYPDLAHIPYPPATRFPDKKSWIQHCVNLVTQQAVTLYKDYLLLAKKRWQDPKAVSIQRIFESFQKVRFLSALRVTELGADRLNQLIAEALLKAGLVQFRHSRESYLGKPILITANDPATQIFSGDIGLMLPDEQKNLRVYFDTFIEVKKTDHSIEKQHLNLSPSRIPQYESAYVMTVHKSQGSEFNHTILVMPLISSPIITKELLYTAVTRAKQNFTLFSNEKIWKQGVSAKIERQSGLTEQLYALLDNGDHSPKLI